MKKLKTKMKEIKVGDIVMWCKSSYIVIKIINRKALLKQNFSIGITLTEMITLDELLLINQNKID